MKLFHSPPLVRALRAEGGAHHGLAAPNNYEVSGGGCLGRFVPRGRYVPIGYNPGILFASRLPHTGDLWSKNIARHRPTLIPNSNIA